MSSRWKAFYYDGKTAERHDVEVEATPFSLIVTKGRDAWEWRYDEVKQTQGFHEGQPVRIEKGEEALVINDTGFLNSLSELTAGSDLRFGPPESKRKKFFLIPVLLFFTAALGLAVYFLVIPRVAAFAAEKVPPSFEDRLGTTFIEELKFGMEECSSPETVDSVTAIMNILEEAARPHPYTFRVYVFKDEMINAFAAPGGHIVIFTGLLEATETPEELAGVLSHEMQHILLKHSTKGIFQDMSTEILLSLLLGDLDGVSGMARSFGNMRYSRILEEEADRRGAELLIKANVDPGGLTSFFEKLGKAEGGMDEENLLRYVSTHPLTGERINYLKEQIGDRPVKNFPLLPNTDWEEVKKTCL